MFSKYLDALNNLDVSTKAQWGIMKPQHMVEHLIDSVRMSNDKLHLECYNPPDKLPTYKRVLLSKRPLPRNFVNPAIGEKLAKLKYDNLQEAIKQLSQEIDDYIVFFEKNPDASLINVTFGDLNKEEWLVFHTKHFTHHLSQFNLLETE